MAAAVPSPPAETLPTAATTPPVELETLPWFQNLLQAEAYTDLQVMNDLCCLIK